MLSFMLLLQYRGMLTAIDLLLGNTPCVMEFLGRCRKICKMPPLSSLSLGVCKAGEREEYGHWAALTYTRTWTIFRMALEQSRHQNGLKQYTAPFLHLLQEYRNKELGPLGMSVPWMSLSTAQLPIPTHVRQTQKYNWSCSGVVPSGCSEALQRLWSWELP